MTKKIIDKILWIEGFYPFSMKYNLKKALEKHKIELESLEVDSTSYSIFQYSNYFNLYFNSICNALEKTLRGSTLSKTTFVELIIADLNRTEIIISEDTKQSLNSRVCFDSNMPANIRIQKPEFQNNTEPVWGLIDSAIETATLNLNYLNHVKFNENIETTNELSQVDVIKNLSLIGSSFNAIKQSYDRIIWRGDVIESDESGIRLKANQLHLKLDNAALTRLTRNIANTQMELQSDSEKHKLIIKTYHTTRHFQIIKSIEYNSGEMILKYQPKTKKTTDSYISYTAPILTYYPFFHLEKISAFDNLTILDLVNIFSSLSDFVMHLPMPNYDDTDVKDIAKFKLFNPKVRKKILLDYFRTTTKYSEKQILIFINLLLNKGEKHDLFLYSIYEEEDYYTFSHSTIKRANMLYLVDKWLEAGKCDLAERGLKFEDYIKDYLRKEKLNEFAKFNIIEQSKFYYFDDKNIRFEEEIDLVIRTETTIIIAEIKCSTYPFEAKDFYSSFQTIKKAKDQVVRKSKFIENHWDKFENILGKKGEREIKKIIIVNFPHYAGRIIDEIPIADFYLFLSYFHSGKYTNVKIERNIGMTVIENPYYDSIHSFEKNFETFFKNPIPIQDLFSRQKIEECEVTVAGTDPKTTVERIVYIEKTANEQ